MSKKKAKPVQAEASRQKNLVVIRGTEEWKAWLDGLADVNQAPITVTIDRALRELAERLKYDKPPRRTP
jgi:hypothetical protein